MTSRLEFAIDAVYRAGRSTLAYFDVDTPVELKQDRSPVTEADRAAESFMRSAIQSKYSGEAILGEEEGLSGSGDERWVLDPIDGTKSFICGVPLYATLLSFEQAGKPILGVCYFPALERMLYAETGAGAFLNGRACRVSRQETLECSTLCCGGHASMAKFGRADGFLRLARNAMTTRTWSDAYGHALVAWGSVEAMIDPFIARWDVSAMQIIVEEAGGRVTDFNGNANPQCEAVSTNGLLHDLVLESFTH
jgi:histidinol-phosphatase